MVLCNECGVTVPPGNNFCFQCGAAVTVVEDPPCSVCGKRMRSGSLYGGSEVTIVFQDGDEERFVQALVCVACGVVKLAIDYDTDVED